MDVQSVMTAADKGQPLVIPASGEERKQLRISAGVSEIVLAVGVGVGHGTIKRWERGTHSPTSPALELRYGRVLRAMQRFADRQAALAS